MFLSPNELRLGSEAICSLRTNSKDGFPDYPASVWEEGVISPLVVRLQSQEDRATATYRLHATANIPFITVDPLLETIHMAGVKHMVLVDSQAEVPVALGEGSWRTIFDPRRGEDSLGSFALVMERGDTLVLVASTGNSAAMRVLPLDSHPPAGSMAPWLSDSLASWKKLVAPGDTITILSDFQDPFRRVARLARLVGGINGIPPRLERRPISMDEFLSAVLDSANSEARWIADQGRSERPSRLLGLERVFFRRNAVLMDWLSQSRQVRSWLTETLDAPVVEPECPFECPDLGGFHRTDYPLPPSGRGHSLALREVQFWNVSSKTSPVWWALYDNGSRTTVWTFEGGIIDGRVLTNYGIERVLPLAGGGVRIQVVGESYRNGSWTEKGVELDFSWSGTDLVLRKVRNLFGWFSGETFLTEDSAAGGWIERRADHPPAALLRRCGYRDPTGEESRGFDWDRNLRISRCITRWEGAVAKFRPDSVKSFIER